MISLRPMTVTTITRIYPERTEDPLHYPTVTETHTYIATLSIKEEILCLLWRKPGESLQFWLVHLGDEGVRLVMLLKEEGNSCSVF